MGKTSPELKALKERVWVELGCAEYYKPITDEEVRAFYKVPQSPDPATTFIPMWQFAAYRNFVPILIVDTEDLELVYRYPFSGHYNRRNDVLRVFASTEDCQTTQLCRIILGVTDNKLHVHHRNQDPLDNRKSNLIACTPKEHFAFHRILRAQKEKGVHLS